MKKLSYKRNNSTLPEGRSERRRGSLKRRAAALALAAMMIACTASSAFASVPDQAGTPKEEVVYINLKPDGSLDGIYVVNSFELDENGKIVDYGDYTALRNMTSSDKILSEGDRITIDTKAGKLYYEGKLERSAIPWIFSVRYFMDGTEYTADKIAGMSGALEIKMSIRKNPEAHGSFFDKYALQASFTLDSSGCRNIVADGATVANVGGDKQLTYIILPGSEKDIDITAEAAGFEMDGIAINGVSMGLDTDIDAEGNPKLRDKLSELHDGIDGLNDGANELMEGAGELRDGAGELKDGISELNDRTGELQDGVNKLADGAASLNDGALRLDGGAAELQDKAGKLDGGAGDLLEGASGLKDGSGTLESGAKDLDNGAGTLYDKLKELDNGIDSLNDGTEELMNGIIRLHSGAAGLSDGAGTLSEGLARLSAQNGNITGAALQVFDLLLGGASEKLAASGFDYTLTAENYSSVLEGILAQIGGDALAAATQRAQAQIEAAAEAAAETRVREAAEAQADSIRAQVEADYGPAISEAAAGYVLAGLMEQGYTEEQIADYKTTQDWTDAVAGAEGTITDRYVEQAIDEAVAAGMASPEVRAQIGTAVAEQLADPAMREQIGQAVQGALGNSQGYAALVALKAQLDGYSAYYNGLLTYTSGVASAASGAAELKSGGDALASGAGSLAEGSDKLYKGLAELKYGSGALLEGARELKNGTANLLDGTIRLHDGTATLYDGVVELKDGTSAFLDGTVELKNGTGELASGTKELQDGGIELRDGVVELRDGVASLLGGSIELRDGTIRLYDGTVELSSGTLEFRDKTGDIDGSISEAVKELLGMDTATVSFVSDKNTRVESLQFVIKTPAVAVEKTESAEPVQARSLNIWQKFLSLFGLYR